MTTDWGRRTVAYIAKCALASGDSLVKADPNGTNYTFPGSLGLCPAWKSGSIATNWSCQEYVSACLMAHLNTAGIHIPIWLDADNQQTSIGWGVDLTNYPYQEGTFFGNLLITGAYNHGGANAPGGFYCDGDGFASGSTGVVAGRIGANTTNVYSNPFGNGALCKYSCTQHYISGVGSTIDGYTACAPPNIPQFNTMITVWRPKTYSPGFDSGYLYKFANVSYSNVVEGYNSGTSSGTKVDGASANSGMNQKFHVLASGSSWKVVPANSSSLCLDESGTYSGSNVVLNSCNGGSSQQWAFEPDTLGNFKMRNIASGLYLRLPSGSSGTQLAVVSSASSNDQLWKITAVQ
jgi:hypothetical protein